VTANPSSSDSPRGGPAPPVAFEVHTDVGGRTAYVRGEVDINTSHTLLEVVEFLAAVDEGDVTLDFEGVTFLDASGLGLVVRCRNHVTAREHRLRLVNPSPTIRRVFDLGGLAAFIDRA
jgi:anti-anti-sigma factor